MSLIQSLFGNATAAAPEKIQGELSPVLLDNESVLMAFGLIRDLIVMTNYRLILVDKKGVTGSKQEILSVPYKSIRKFSCENAGFLDGDGELRVWITGEVEPMKFELAKTVDVRGVYKYLSHFVLAI